MSKPVGNPLYNIIAIIIIIIIAKIIWVQWTLKRGQPLNKGQVVISTSYSNSTLVTSEIRGQPLSKGQRTRPQLVEPLYKGQVGDIFLSLRLALLRVSTACL